MGLTVRLVLPFQVALSTANLSTSSESSRNTTRHSRFAPNYLIHHALLTHEQVKSGGHAFNPNTSSTLGVLVVTNRFNKIEYKSADQTATIGLGTRWEEVYAALEPFKRTVTGARVPHVGVGGFIANGGAALCARFS